uniref:Transposase n=1 Tax=Romanomermis culicivorax TaxID=13658 RepID=A0A915JKB6_ROMCU
MLNIEDFAVHLPDLDNQLLSPIPRIQSGIGEKPQQKGEPQTRFGFQFDFAALTDQSSAGFFHLARFALTFRVDVDATFFALRVVFYLRRTKKWLAAALFEDFLTLINVEAFLGASFSKL